MKKMIFAVLVFALAAGFLSSCSEKPAANNTGETQVSSQDVDAQPTEEKADEFADRQNIDDGLGAFDFGGEAFTVIYEIAQMVEPYFAEEQIGSPINDAVYRRNLDIEERFNIKFKIFDTAYDRIVATISKSVMAGSGDYDFGLAHTYVGLSGAISKGQLYDWNKTPAVDMDKPWWNASVKERLSINGRVFVASSDYVYQRPGVIYFNKAMIKNLALENPYELVRGGDWTWDKLSEMAARASADLNGDGVFDKNDQYGYAHWVAWQTVAVIHSNGLFLTENDEDGYPRFTPFLTEKMKTVFEKYHDLIYVGNKTFNIPGSEEVYYIGSTTPLFGSGQVLFLHSNTELLKPFAGLELEFGMLPLPKYDKLQKDYRCMGDTQMMVIPSDAKNIDMSGVISEALSVYSYKYVVPAVYSVMYANRYLRDEESYEMFNLIRKGIVYEFAWTFGEGNSMAYAFPTVINQKSTDIVSFCEKNAPNAEKALAKLIDSVSALD